MSLDTDSGAFGSAEGFADAFYPLFTRLFDEDGDFAGTVGERLTEARMNQPVELYVSRALGVGVLVGVLLWLVGSTIGWGLFALGIVSEETFSLGVPAGSAETAALLESLTEPAAVLVGGLLFGSVGFGLGFGTLIAIPYQRANAREREIDMLLSDAVSFMYALSVGGLNQLEILEAMAEAEDTYGEVAREFQSIVQETSYFGTDYRNAVRQQAIETPSDELAQFLSDMLSIINSGGDMERFLHDKKEKHLRTSKQQQELSLETLELFGEMYMTLSLFPLLLIIILVIMSMLGQGQEFLLTATVYVLTPLIGVGFLVLVSTVKQDEPGDGYLNPGGVDEQFAEEQREGLFHLGLVEAFAGEFSLFDRIRSREGTYKTEQLLKAPHHFFRDNPLFTLALTVPATLVLLGLALAGGRAPTTWQGFVDRPVWATFVWVYVPAYVTLIPLVIFYEWQQRRRSGITGKLSDTLRKLSSANDTGQTLLESIQTTAETSKGTLSEEFEVIYAKVNYGTSLREALVEFNNEYHIPRLARTVKLISEAQQASSQITDVLTTAAQASENRDDIERERVSRTRMQVAIILMTYLTLLGVMAILKLRFLDVLAGLTEQAGSAGGGGSAGGDGLGSGGFAGGVNVDRLSVLFFHAVTIQAVLSGVIAGYIRSADIVSGMKFVVVLLSVALGVWVVVA